MRAIRRIAWVFVPLIALGWSVASVAADPYAFAPLLTVDKNVAERGTPITITLTGFAPSQPYTLTVSTSSDYGQGSVIATLPANTDGSGTGSAMLPTGGLATGNYAISIAGADGVQLPQVGAAFGIIDPGTLGPRVVRVYPMPQDEG
jgi:hypothetical protein